MREISGLKIKRAATFHYSSAGSDFYRLGYLEILDVFVVAFNEGACVVDFEKERVMALKATIAEQ